MFSHQKRKAALGSLTQEIQVYHIKNQNHNNHNQNHILIKVENSASYSKCYL